MRVCHGADGGGGPADLRLNSFDGSPLEVYVILPPAPASGSDGGYPLMIQSHGWGGSAGGVEGNGYAGPTAHAWASDGYGAAADESLSTFGQFGAVRRWVLTEVSHS